MNTGTHGNDRNCATIQCFTLKLFSESRAFRTRTNLPPSPQNTRKPCCVPGGSSNIRNEKVESSANARLSKYMQILGGELCSFPGHGIFTLPSLLPSSHSRERTSCQRPVQRQSRRPTSGSRSWSLPPPPRRPTHVPYRLRSR